MLSTVRCSTAAALPRLVALAVCVTWSVAALFANAGSPATDKSGKSAALFVLHGMARAREEFRSGVCAISYLSEYKNVTSPRDSNVVRATAQLWYAGNDRYRMDWTYPQSGGNPPFHDDVAWSSASKERTGYFIHAKDRNIQWDQGRRTINILPPDSRRPEWVIYFDVKALGIHSWIVFWQGESWEDSISTLLQPEHLPNVAAISNDVYSLTTERRKGRRDTQWVVEVDAGRGFTPVHSFMRYRISETAPWQNIEDIETAWQEEAGVWVPTSFEIDERQSPKVATERLAMKLSWSGVNQPIPDELFSYKSLGAPKAVEVVDSRLGTPVMIEHGGSKSAHARPASKRASRLIALLVSGALLIMLIAIFAARRLRKRSLRNVEKQA